MELWIRSQDKEILYKVNELFLNCKICEELGIKEYYVNVNHEVFGTYKTQERALEVLDEIQNMIKPILINTEYHSEIKQDTDKVSFDVVMTPIEDKITYIQPNVIVYEMPKE